MCRQRGWGMFPGTLLPCRTDDQVARIVAVNGTHRPPDALEPLVCGLGRTETRRHQMSPKEHGVVDAIVPTKNRRGLPVRPTTAVRQPPRPARTGVAGLALLRCPLPAPVARTC